MTQIYSPLKGSKKKLCLISFIYVLATFEHQVKNRCQFVIKLALVKNVSASCIFLDNGLNSPPFLEQNQFWRVYHWFQRQ